MNIERYCNYDAHFADHIYPNMHAFQYQLEAFGGVQPEVLNDLEVEFPYAVEMLTAMVLRSEEFTRECVRTGFVESIRTGENFKHIQFAKDRKADKVPAFRISQSDQNTVAEVKYHRPGLGSSLSMKKNENGLYIYHFFPIDDTIEMEYSKLNKNTSETFLMYASDVITELVHLSDKLMNKPFLKFQTL